MVPIRSATSVSTTGTWIEGTVFGVQVELTDDQALVHETAARFVDAELPLTATRRFHDDPIGYDRSWLRKSAELGWYGMLVPEALGGGCVSEHGILDAVIVAEVLGRAVQPGPFLPVNVVASALATGGSARLQAEVLPALVAGAESAAWAWVDEAGEPDGGAGVLATAVGERLSLTGRRGFVLEAPSAEHLLVAATLDGRPVQVLVPADAGGVSRTPLTALDLSRRFAHVDLDGVDVAADAVVEVDGDDLLRTAVVLLLAETVGAMDALFEMTVAYAKDRVAFGRPIGSFQAIKHVLADQAMFLEACKAGADAAARAVAGGDDDGPAVVHMAASYLGEHGPELAQECLQVHGGIGYTWEHDLHLLLRRIRSNALLFGGPAWHREQLCRLHGFGGSA
jgi:alkylation response protein AidB-like acyl-CoA dehydrogenase